MRTAVSTTRGTSPFELMFGRQPTSSFDLLYNQQVKKWDNPDNLSEYLLVRTRRNELAKVFAQENLRKNIENKQQFYVEIERAFQPRDLVSLFPPINNTEVSEKLDSFWTGPWKILSRLAPTTYTIENLLREPDKPHKTHIVQVDMLKKFFEEDQPVTPLVDFDPNPKRGEMSRDHFPFKPKKQVAKAMVNIDVIEKNDPADNDPSNLKVIPPWNSHVDPNIPLPDKIVGTPVSKPKKLKVQRQKPVKRYVGLPIPLTTRSKAKQNDITISSLAYSDLLQRQQPSDQPEFDVDIYDQFFEQRYL